ncbi:hypothetical protein BaRGS_00021864, partial [Batillaria attramentaria]
TTGGTDKQVERTNRWNGQTGGTDKQVERTNRRTDITQNAKPCDYPRKGRKGVCKIVTGSTEAGGAVLADDSRECVIDEVKDRKLAFDCRLRHDTQLRGRGREHSYP